MFLKKQGLPEEDELVLCTVTKIYYQSVFVNIDEYERSGMIPISEIAPGRIRNIRDFVKEGKKVVCKVLRIDKEKGHVDLSLRRVNDAQRRQKLSQIKQEQLAENIVEFLAKKQKKDTKKFYSEVTKKLFEEYESLFDAFEEVSNDTLDLSEYVDKKLAEELTELIKQRIKPPIVDIKGALTLKSYLPDGVEVIKEGLKKSLTKTVWGSEYDMKSTHFCASNSSIIKSTATFPTLPMPGSPSMRIGFFSLGSFFMIFTFQFIAIVFPLTVFSLLFFCKKRVCLQENILGAAEGLFFLHNCMCVSC